MARLGSQNECLSRCILVAEDNPADVYLIREALFSQPEQGAVIDLVVMPDGEQAVEYLLQRGRYAGKARPDLIVLDLNLPKMDGVEVLRTIRANDALSKIPVIVFTSSDSPNDRKIIRTLGADRYITKPSDLDGFMAVGGTLLSYFKGAQSAG